MLLLMRVIHHIYKRRVLPRLSVFEKNYVLKIKNVGDVCAGVVRRESFAVLL